MDKLKWSQNYTANTATHSYRIDIAGKFTFAVATRLADGKVTVSDTFQGIEYAKQWAQQHHEGEIEHG